MYLADVRFRRKCYFPQWRRFGDTRSYMSQIHEQRKTSANRGRTMLTTQMSQTEVRKLKSFHCACIYDFATKEKTYKCF